MTYLSLSLAPTRHRPYISEVRFFWTGHENPSLLKQTVQQH